MELGLKSKGEAVNSDFQKTSFFFKSVSIFGKKVLIMRKKVGYFWCQQFQILELKKVFALKKFFSSPISMWQIPALLQTSLNFPQLEGAPGQPLTHFSACIRWCIIQPPNRRHTVKQSGLPQLKT